MRRKGDNEGADCASSWRSTDSASRRQKRSIDIPREKTCLKLGAQYDLTMCELGDDGYIDMEYPLWTAIEVAMPVVKFSREGDEWIINTTLPRNGLGGHFWRCHPCHAAVYSPLGARLNAAAVTGE
jgi:hypothetical protein